jgi:hypothetical protein
MRYLVIALSTLLCLATSAHAQVSVGIEVPGISIGINTPAYPELVQVPDYPVYYDPHASANYFFYDGAYWVYSGDTWYMSDWYNGPWQSMSPDEVPLFVLRVPVEYYRHPPAYFLGWRADAAPRWDEHWGRDWQDHHAGWDQWDHRSAPVAAPLPTYQRQYSGDRYPSAAEQQHVLRAEHYNYKPREAVTQQFFQRQAQPQKQATQHQAQPQQQAPQQQATQHQAQPNQQAVRHQAQPNQQATQQQAQPQQQATQRQARSQQQATQHQAQPKQQATQRQAQPQQQAQENKVAQHDNKNGEQGH